MKAFTRQTYQRLPLYLSYLRSLPTDGAKNVSATAIAEGLGLNDVQVRKDLAAVSDGGKPKIGYITEELIADIERALGGDDTDDAVLVGVGNLGRALLSYDGFGAYGLKIVAGFDANPEVVGQTVGGKQVLDVSRLRNLCERLRVRIGILAVPGPQAQQACDALVAGGVRAIWNFSSSHLNTPEGVIVRHENLACSLAVLSKQLVELLGAE